MTGFAISTPFQIRRSAGLVWLGIVTLVLAALAVGSFALGRVTGSDSTSTPSVHTVYLQSVPGSNAQACHVNTPC